VFVSDSGTIKEKYVLELSQAGIAFEAGQHTEALILNAGEIIVSPGIPDKAAIIKAALAAGIPLISEIEFAARYTRATKICITGSNGKTTTTLLTYHMFQKAGLKVGLAGNVGLSLARQVAQNDFDYYVIELSSFQLDKMYQFKAEIAILMNITPDHLDRYQYDFQLYINSKLRVIQNQTSADYFIFCADDPIIQQEIAKRTISSQLLPFTLSASTNPGGWVSNEKINIYTHNSAFDMNIYDLALQGQHNVYNSMAASLSGSVVNIRKSIIRESLADFQGVEHRLEYYLKIHGIQFINDSKATNVNSTWYALESMNAPTIWIAGGIDKGNDYSSLYELVGKKVKALICLGVDNSKLHEAFQDKIDIILDAGSMPDAIKMAYHLGEKGDNVLLSPACASFDLFENYEHRGRMFKQSVREL
ncbi:MAG: UDP-N-acetylmuramoyl-L-alanine--D-glutamate ligase, partial [Bacteroidales bacterium]|nr:UDP-N-acetylmuramoyl-L-alanine--D-glutamate ligase [Bacteroidales bacterium]